MKFHIENTFHNISLISYEALYFDEAYHDALSREVKLDRVTKKNELVARHLSRVVVISPDREIPAPAAKVIGSNKIHYTEYTEYTFGSRRGTWRIEPGFLPEKITAGGTFEFREVPGGVQRLVGGEISVRIFGLGGVVEKFIVNDIEKSYARASAFCQRWIDEGKAEGFGEEA